MWFLMQARPSGIHMSLLPKSLREAGNPPEGEIRKLRCRDCGEAWWGFWTNLECPDCSGLLVNR